MSERRTQQPIRVTQFDPGCNQGRVNDRGVIHRVVMTRTVRFPGFGGCCQMEVLPRKYYYIKYAGREFEVVHRNNASPTGGAMWTLQLHGDEPWCPDPVKAVKT